MDEFITSFTGWMGDVISRRLMSHIKPDRDKVKWTNGRTHVDTCRESDYRIIKSNTDHFKRPIRVPIEGGNLV